MHRFAPLVALLFATPAFATPGGKKFTTIEGTDVVSLMQEAGHGAVLKIDEVGDPMVAVEVDGTKYVVLFYDCTDHRKCQVLQFRAFWTLGKPTPIERINEWNRTRLLGRAYLDEDRDPTLEVMVRLRGGVTWDNLRDQHRWFIRALDEFQSVLAEIQEAPSAQTL